MIREQALFRKMTPGSNERKLRLPALCFTFLLAVVLFIPSGLEYYNLERRVKQLKVEQKDLVEYRDRLRQEIKEASRDTYVEKRAREDLGMVYQGETLLVLAVPGKTRPLKVMNSKEFKD